MMTQSQVEPAEDLRADLKNHLGLDYPMLKFILANPSPSQEVRDYIERRIAAGNLSAKLQKEIMINFGSWYDLTPSSSQIG